MNSCNGSISFEKYGVKLYKNNYGTIMVDRHFYRNPEEQLYKLIPIALGEDHFAERFESGDLSLEITTEWKDIHKEKMVYDGFTIQPDMFMDGYHSEGGSYGQWYFEIKNGEITNNDMIQALLAKSLITRKGKPHIERYNEKIKNTWDDDNQGTKYLLTFSKYDSPYYGIIGGYVTPERRKILEHFGVFVLLHKDYIKIQEEIL